MAIGLFFSMLLLMPFQMLGAAIIAMRLGANIPFAMAACWLSNPVTSIPLVLAQFRLGEWLRVTLGLPMPEFLERAHLTIRGAGTLNAASFVLGSFSMALVLALCAYPLVHLFSAILPQHLPVRPRDISAARRRFRESGVS